MSKDLYTIIIDTPSDQIINGKSIIYDQLVREGISQPSHLTTMNGEYAISVYNHVCTRFMQSQPETEPVDENTVAKFLTAVRQRCLELG